MGIGLSQEAIEEILLNEGIKSGEAISAELMRKAIATVIVKNNAKIESEVTAVVASKITRDLNRGGIR